VALLSQYTVGYQAEASQPLLCPIIHFVNCAQSLSHIYLTCFYQADFAVLAEFFAVVSSAKTIPSLPAAGWKWH